MLKRFGDFKPQFVINDRKVECIGCPELEALDNPGYMIGEGIATFGSCRGPLYLANTETGKVKKFVDEDGNVVGFTKDDIDYKSLEGVEHTYNAYAMKSEYSGIGRYNDFEDGICAYCWTLYPDGRYFADEDGFGMEDNDEVEIYCVIDRDFNVLRPFQYGKNPITMLNEVKEERNHL